MGRRADAVILTDFSQNSKLYGTIMALEQRAKPFPPRIRIMDIKHNRMTFSLSKHPDDTNIDPILEFVIYFRRSNTTNWVDMLSTPYTQEYHPYTWAILVQDTSYEFKAAISTQNGWSKWSSVVTQKSYIIYIISLVILFCLFTKHITNTTHILYLIYSQSGSKWQ